MSPKIVYFSSVTENTHIFVNRLPFPSERIPLYKKDPELLCDEPYILFVPTYGGGRGEAAVPPQVKRFLNVKENRMLCIGVIGAGNINFGDKYAIAGDIVAQKLKVPVLYRFELRGTLADLNKVTEGITEHWDLLRSQRAV